MDFYIALSSLKIHIAQWNNCTRNLHCETCCKIIILISWKKRNLPRQEIHHWSTVKRLVRSNIGCAGTKAGGEEMQVTEITFISLSERQRTSDKGENSKFKSDKEKNKIVITFLKTVSFSADVRTLFHICSLCINQMAYFYFTSLNINLTNSTSTVSLLCCDGF